MVLKNNTFAVGGDSSVRSLETFVWKLRIMLSVGLVGDFILLPRNLG